MHRQAGSSIVPVRTRSFLLTSTNSHRSSVSQACFVGARRGSTPDPPRRHHCGGCFSALCQDHPGSHFSGVSLAQACKGLRGSNLKLLHRPRKVASCTLRMDQRLAPHTQPLERHFGRKRPLLFMRFGCRSPEHSPEHSRLGPSSTALLGRRASSEQDGEIQTGNARVHSIASNSIACDEIHDGLSST